MFIRMYNSHYWQCIIKGWLRAHVKLRKKIERLMRWLHNGFSTGRWYTLKGILIGFALRNSMPHWSFSVSSHILFSPMILLHSSKMLNGFRVQLVGCTISCIHYTRNQDVHKWKIITSFEMSHQIGSVHFPWRVELKMYQRAFKPVKLVQSIFPWRAELKNLVQI